MDQKKNHFFIYIIQGVCFSSIWSLFYQSLHLSYKIYFFYILVSNSWEKRDRIVEKGKERESFHLVRFWPSITLIWMFIGSPLRWQLNGCGLVFNDDIKSILELENFILFDLILSFKPIETCFMLENRALEIYRIYFFVCLSKNGLKFKFWKSRNSNPNFSTTKGDRKLL